MVLDSDQNMSMFWRGKNQVLENSRDVYVYMYIFYHTETLKIMDKVFFIRINFIVVGKLIVKCSLLICLKKRLKTSPLTIEILKSSKRLQKLEKKLLQTDLCYFRTNDFRRWKMIFP